MLLTQYVQFTICANTPARLAVWTRHFRRVFGASTAFLAEGDWEGIREVNVIIRHWSEDLSTVADRLVSELRRYKRIERQQALFLEVYNGKCITGHVVADEADWQDLSKALDYGLWLADYFTASAETGAGCDVSDHHWQH